MATLRHFSGSLAAVGRRAAELGRKAVWTIFDPEASEHRMQRRWVPADRVQ